MEATTEHTRRFCHRFRGRAETIRVYGPCEIRMVGRFSLAVEHEAGTAVELVVDASRAATEPQLAIESD
jgi:hypothetical protein